MENIRPSDLLNKPFQAPNVVMCEFSFSLGLLPHILESHSFHCWPFTDDLSAYGVSLQAWPLSAWLVHPHFHEQSEIPGHGHLGLLWWVRVVVRAAWRQQALQILMYLRSHKLYCLQGGSKAWRLPEGQGSLMGKLAQPLANLAPYPCFSVTVDPNMLRSDVFVDFLKRVQLVSLLFFAKVLVSLQDGSLREPRACFRPPEPGLG